MEKQLRLHTIIAGVVALVVMVAGWAFWKFKQLDVVNATISQTETKIGTDKATANDLAKNLKAEKIETEKLDLAKKQVDYFHHRYRSINFNLTSDGYREATWLNMMHEYFNDYGVELRRQLVQTAQDSNVLLSTSAKVNDPPQMPELVDSPATGFFKPLNTTNGGMDATVIGTMPNILNFFQRINQNEILMGVGNVKLEGVSPLIKASFSITPYLPVTGPSAAPLTGAAAATTSTTTTTGEPGSSPAASAPPAP